MANIFKIVSWFRILFLLIIPFAMLAEVGGKPDPEKRKEVVEKVKLQMQVFNMELPEWLDKVIDDIIGILVDVMVAIMKKMGFFKQSNDNSNLP